MSNVQVSIAALIYRHKVENAWIDGEIIEYSNKYHRLDAYIVTTEPKFDWMNCNYRIKEKEHIKPVTKYVGVFRAQGGTGPGCIQYYTIEELYADCPHAVGYTKVEVYLK